MKNRHIYHKYTHVLNDYIKTQCGNLAGVGYAADQCYDLCLAPTKKSDGICNGRSNLYKDLLWFVESYCAAGVMVKCSHFNYKVC